MVVYLISCHPMSDLYSGMTWLVDYIHGYVKCVTLRWYTEQEIIVNSGQSSDCTASHEPIQVITVIIVTMSTYVLRQVFAPFREVVGDL